MVCLGNICRSPLAEGILRSKINHTNSIVDSAGTAAYHVGNPPDPRSIEIGLKYGIDIRDQRARKFEILDFDRFDQILVMDRSNYQNVIRLSRSDSDRSKVSLILDHSSQDQFSEVPDPYYGGKDGFELVFKLLDDACERIAETI